MICVQQEKILIEIYDLFIRYETIYPEVFFKYTQTNTHRSDFNK